MNQEKLQELATEFFEKVSGHVIVTKRNHTVILEAAPKAIFHGTDIAKFASATTTELYMIEPEKITFVDKHPYLQDDEELDDL